MNETSTSSLTDQALSRLKRLADGNGLTPEQIELMGSEEKVYVLEGTMTLIPKCTAQSGQYPGPVRGRDRQIYPSVAEMRAEATKLQDEFQKGTGWIEACKKELRAEVAEGWGLDSGEITLTEQSAILAASEMCPTCGGGKLLTCQQCNGQGLVVCAQCYGRGQEVCPGCGGTGENPAQPGQRCVICNGNREAPCRYCQGRGQLACPTCHGQRGTACPACKATGLITEEISLSCGAETHFKLVGEGLPSGLRRGLDRLGIANLVKGHADIETVAPKPGPNEAPVEEGENDTKAKAPVPVMYYNAKLPYSDLRMNFNGKKALVSAFGKRCSLLGVPSFLDDALEPACEKLKLAARGKAKLDEALNPRAIREALMLVVGGKNTVEEFRRLYPVGLSPEAMKEILSFMRLALNRFTLIVRSIVAVLCVILGAVLFASIFLTPFHAHITLDRAPSFEITLDGLVLLGAMAFGWFILSLSIRFMLRRRFPNFKIPIHQKIGKTGYTMLAGILVVYGIVLALAPTKPAWLLQILN